MRGYFAIGIERASKPGNVGNLIRTAHAFGAAFVFVLRAGLKGDAAREIARARADTANTAAAIPFYEYERLEDLVLPRGCRLVAVEITAEATELPVFHHPLNAAYILGGERLSLSDETLARADHVIKIPTRFSLNVATAGAIVMYDRLLSYGRFARRPVASGDRPAELPPHVHGGPVMRRRPGGETE
ncbi:MAG: RNA methyltransferase [Rhodothalassiaceae bacterium]